MRCYGAAQSATNPNKEESTGDDRTLRKHQSGEVDEDARIMKRALFAAMLIAAVVPALPTPAAAAPDTRCANDKLKESYSAHWFAVKAKLGSPTQGRNIRRDGMTGGRKSRCSDLRKSRVVLRRMLHPAPVYAPAPVATAPSAPSAPAGYSAPASSGAGGPEQFVGCESGGDWDVVNKDSGAYGRYQLMPMHFESGGLCAGMGKDPAGQTACAREVYKVQGSGAWSQCGG